MSEAPTTSGLGPKGSSSDDDTKAHSTCAFTEAQVHT